MVLPHSCWNGHHPKIQKTINIGEDVGKQCPNLLLVGMSIRASIQKPVRSFLRYLIIDLIFNLSHPSSWNFHKRNGIRIRVIHNHMIIAGQFTIPKV